MKTPAQLRRESVLAKKAKDDTPKAKAQHANAYELMLAKLDADKRALKRLQSVERKIAAKKKMLPDYAGWITGALEANKGGQDDVLTTVMVWLMDTGDFPAALIIAEHAIRHRLSLPDNYARTLGCLIAEEVADAALQAFSTGGKFDLETLERTLALTREEDMPDEVRAKLYKAIGHALEAADRKEEALAALTEALRLHPKVGVKKDIEQLERAIRNAKPNNPDQSSA